MAESGESASPTRRRVVVLEALRVVLGRPPVWLSVFALECLLACLPALLFFQWMQAAIQNRYPAERLFSTLDATFRFDQRTSLAGLESTTGQVGAWLALLAILAGCFCAGGWLQVFLERTHGESMRRYFFGGARYFWRFFRLALLSLATLALFHWLFFGWPWNQLVLHMLWDVPSSDFQRLETLGSEATAHALRLTQDVLFFVATALVFAWGDYTRTRLALHDTSSAVWAGLMTWYTVLRHPVKTLRPLLGLVALEAAIVTALGWFARSVEGDIATRPPHVGVSVLFATGLLALLWRVVLRGARYHAAIQVSREVVLPIARPDPWKSSLGGPGGPRYPLDGDEYGMSL